MGSYRTRQQRLDDEYVRQWKKKDKGKDKGRFAVVKDVGAVFCFAVALCTGAFVGLLATGVQVLVGVVCVVAVIVGWKLVEGE